MPKISIIAVFFEMQREAGRTLVTLARAYQRNCADLDYEVIVVDNGSKRMPLTGEFVCSFGPEFRLLKHQRQTVSPASACNAGVEAATGDAVMVLIDGARMLSPGLLYYTSTALRAFRNPFVYTIGMHLGPRLQNNLGAGGDSGYDPGP